MASALLVVTVPVRSTACFEARATFAYHVNVVKLLLVTTYHPGHLVGDLVGIDALDFVTVRTVDWSTSEFASPHTVHTASIIAAPPMSR